MLPTNLPTYIQNPNQENYNEEFNRILRLWLSSNGWAIANQTAANIAILKDDVSIPIGTLWFNTDSLKLQVKTVAGIGTGTIETITST